MTSKLLIKRKEHQMKQREVAEKLGISNQSYHLKESGKRQFTVQEAIMLSKVFGCTLDDLF